MDWRYVRFKYETFLLASFLLPSTQYVKPGRENGHEIATLSARNDIWEINEHPTTHTKLDKPIKDGKM
jgi:hypothetical protein